MRLVPILFLSAAVLSGCSAGPKVKFLGTEFRQSPELRSCANAPSKPQGDYTQKDVAKYIKKYEAAHVDCKEDLSSLNKEIDGFNKAVRKKTSQKSK